MGDSEGNFQAITLCATVLSLILLFSNPSAFAADATLVVIKNVINDDGGTAVPSDFTMMVSAVNPSNTSFPGINTVSYAQSFGSMGSTNGQFDFPRAVAVDSTDRIIVADDDNDRIQIFNSAGTHIQSFGSFGSADGQFRSPAGIAVDSTDRIIVVDRNNHRIQIFDSAGTHIQSFGSNGTADGQFVFPDGVAVDSADRIIVADSANNRIQIFNSAGTHIQTFGSFGTADGQFSSLRDIAVDSADRIIVMDTNNDRIQIFNSVGTHIQSFGNTGTADGQFGVPRGIAVDSEDRIIVADSNNDRIQIFNSAGTHIQSFGSFGTANGQFNFPEGIATDSADRIIVVDTNNHRIQILDYGTTVTIDSGAFSVTESGPAGYSAMFLGCNGTAVAGESYTCTIINNDISPNASLTVIKNVINDDAGISTPADFTMNIAAINPSDNNFVGSNITHVQSFGSLGTANGQFNSSNDLTSDSANRIIVADTSNHRIQIFDSAGTHIQSFGSFGSADGQFNNPRGIAVDSTDRILVADVNNNRIQIFDSAGTHIQSFGSFGTANGQFSFPTGVAVDSADRIIVMDTNNDRIQIFNSAGTHIQSFGSFGTTVGQFDSPRGIVADSNDRIIVVDTSNQRVQIFDSSGNIETSFGSFGTANGQFNFPIGVAVDSADNILVVDNSNYRLQIFDSGGNHLQSFGSFGTADGQFNLPQGIATDSADRILVADTFNNRVQIFNYGGTTITIDPGAFSVTESGPAGYNAMFFGCNGTAVAGESYTCTIINNDTPTTASITIIKKVINDDDGISGPADFTMNVLAGNPSQNNFAGSDAASHLLSFGSTGPSIGQLNSPQGTAVDSSNRIIVADRNNDRVQIFDSTGTHIQSFGSLGTADGQFNSPIDVAVDTADRIIVADRNNNRVQIFDSTGTHIQSFGSPGTADGQFIALGGIAVDSANRILVSELGNARIQIFDSTGTHIQSFGSPGTANGQFNFPQGITTDSVDRILVADTNNARIQIFNSAGTHIQSFGSPGTADGQFNSPIGVAVDTADRIIVADRNNNRVQIFDSTGTHIQSFGSPGTANGQFNFPQGITTDSADRILVADTNNDRLQIFVAGITITIDPGAFSVTESGPAGYNAMFLGCNGTAVAGESYTCTIINNDEPEPGMLKIIKKTIGGDDEFNFDSDTPIGNFDITTTAGMGMTIKQNITGIFNVTENVPIGWNLLNATCNDGSLINSIDIISGEFVTCTFWNEKEIQIPSTATLKVIKLVVGGQNEPLDFIMNVDAVNPSLSIFPGDDDGTMITIDPGFFAVTETGPDGYIATFSGCEGSAVAGQSYVCTITNTFEIPQTESTQLHGLKYEDHNGNGKHDNGEPYLNGWTVFLDENNNGMLDDGENDRVTHDSPQGEPGHYWFTELPFGNYTVCEVLQNNWVQTQPGTPQNAKCYDVTLDADNLKFHELDFGNFELGRIHGLKYEDLNGNGQWNNGEPYLNGWKIFLDEDNDKKLDNHETDRVTHDNPQGEPGHYWFTELKPGDYNVCEVLQNNWVQTQPGTIQNAKCYDVTMQSGQSYENLDFGNLDSSIVQPTSCIVPDYGPMVVTTDCQLTSNGIAPENVIVQNNSVLTIPNGITLDIDFANFNITVEFGSGVYIEAGGAIT